MAVDKKHVFTRLVQFDLERLDTLADLVSAGVDRGLDELRALGGDEDEGIEFYADEAGAISELSGVFSQLAAVGLYSVVELRTKSLLRHHLAEAEVQEAFRIKELKRFYRRVTGKTLASVPGFRAVDELRCLNNAVKHDGSVSATLAAFPNWTLGRQLGDVSGAFDRLRKEVPRYLEALAHALL